MCVIPEPFADTVANQFGFLQDGNFLCFIPKKTAGIFLSNRHPVHFKFVTVM
jgi:hypothetical protein